jgi:hypothetical protein
MFGKTHNYEGGKWCDMMRKPLLKTGQERMEEYAAESAGEFALHSDDVLCDGALDEYL